MPPLNALCGKQASKRCDWLGDLAAATGPRAVPGSQHRALRRRLAIKHGHPVPTEPQRAGTARAPVASCFSELETPVALQATGALTQPTNQAMLWRPTLLPSVSLKTAINPCWPIEVRGLMT